MPLNKETKPNRKEVTSQSMSIQDNTMKTKKNIQIVLPAL